MGTTLSIFNDLRKFVGVKMGRRDLEHPQESEDMVRKPASIVRITLLYFLLFFSFTVSSAS